MVDMNVNPVLEMLTKYVASGVGRRVGQWLASSKARARLIEAKAKADSLKIIADAQAAARRDLVAPDQEAHVVLDIDADGIRQRIEFQEKKRQANIVSVVRGAAADLGDKEVLAHEPDPDWTARFFDCVQDVSSEDMRKLWAKVLSGEIEGPGRTSLRTLDILRNMTKRDAEIFRSVCDYVIDNFIYYPNYYQTKHGILFLDNILHLQNVGLITSSSFLVKNLHFSSENRHALCCYQNRLLRITAMDNVNKIEIPQLLLTKSGKELYRILQCHVDENYLASFSNFLKEKNCDLSYARIFFALPDGRVNHAGLFIPIEPKPDQPDVATP